MNKIRIAVAGASGRMGRMLVESILKAPDTALVAAFETLRERQSMPVSTMVAAPWAQTTLAPPRPLSEEPRQPAPPGKATHR